MNLTKNIVIFDPEAVLSHLKQVFGDRFVNEQTSHYGTTRYTIHKDMLYVRLNNGNSFHIFINNEEGWVHIDVRRKFTSLKPDYEEKFSIEHYCMKSLIDIIVKTLDTLNVSTNKA